MSDMHTSFWKLVASGIWRDMKNALVGAMIGFLYGTLFGSILMWAAHWLITGERKVCP